VLERLLWSSGNDLNLDFNCCRTGIHIRGGGDERHVIIVSRHSVTDEVVYLCNLFLAFPINQGHEKVITCIPASRDAPRDETNL
jgi:hypothetical protein